MALEPEERRLLAAFAEIHSPSVSDAAEALVRVRARLDRGEDLTIEPSRHRRRLAVGMGVVAVAAALALALRLDLGSMLAEEDGGQSQPEAAYAGPGDAADAGGRAIDRAPGSRRIDGRTTGDRESQVSPEPGIDEPSTEAAPHSGTEKKRHDPRTRSRRRATPDASDATLHAEIALLRPAQQALHTGSYGRALELFDTHARSFPDSTLAEERTLGRIEALCGLGRGQEARAAAASFVRRFPGSPLRAKARRACVEDEDR